MILGMDFGTTNSGLAVYDGSVRLLPLDPANAANPAIVRTILYISNWQQHLYGRAAIDEYYEQNHGRPIRLRREHIGEISLTYADLGTFYSDVYVWVDELEPGRLFRSLKTFLPDESYLGTAVWGRYYTLEDLAAAFLRLLKARAEEYLGTPVEEIVLGRPVRFGDTPETDALAERRLARAAILAGYKRAYFELEPVAAALYYAQSIDRPERVVVFDFGGGTLDVTVMELDGAGGSEVLSTGGVRVAGDVFDQRIVRRRLARRLGEDLTYGPKHLTMPVYLYDDLTDWQALMLLNRPEILRFLGEVEGLARQREPIRALSSLIKNNYGLMMFEQVERAKTELSSVEETIIRLAGQDLDIAEPLTRGEFEILISTEIETISHCVDEALVAAQMPRQKIDAVVRTGGSSLIPAFQRLLERKFGRSKVRPVDEFTSVAAGLGIAALEVEQGRRELRSYSDEILHAGGGKAESGADRTAT
jgi:hypothetical chaperone protein